MRDVDSEFLDKMGQIQKLARVEKMSGLAPLGRNARTSVSFWTMSTAAAVDASAGVFSPAAAADETNPKHVFS